MDINNITIKNKIDQKRVFNEFIKYCKFYGISTNEYGQQIVNVTNGKNNYAMVVKFTPKEAKLGEMDTIVVQGLAPYNYSLEELLKTIISFSSQKIEIVVDKEKFRPVDSPLICCDNSLISKNLGWKPIHDVKETLKSMYESFLGK